VPYLIQLTYKAVVPLMVANFKASAEKFHPLKKYEKQLFQQKKIFHTSRQNNLKTKRQYCRFAKDWCALYEKGSIAFIKRCIHFFAGAGFLRMQSLNGSKAAPWLTS